MSAPPSRSVPDWSAADRLVLAYAGPPGAAPVDGAPAAGGRQLLWLLPEGAARPETGAVARYGAAPWAEPSLLARLGAWRAWGAVVLTEGGATPFELAYLCYLARVPRRAAITAEFGGGVLTAAVPPEAARGPRDLLRLLNVARAEAP